MDVKGFILKFFAIIGLVLVFTIGLGVWGALNLLGPSLHTVEAKAPELMVLDLDFSVPLVEQQPDFRFDLTSLFDEEGQRDYFSIVRAILRAKDDPKVKGLVARFGVERPAFVHVQEIADALRQFRASGKFTYVFAPSYGDFAPGGSGIYALASQFENIWLQPVGAVGLTGLAMEAPFGKAALGKLGVEADFLRREDYKSVMENVTNDAFTAPVKANMTGMIGDIAEQIANEIAKGRKVDSVAVRKLMEDGPYTANEALKANLVTKIGYEDDMLKEVETKAGKEAQLIDVDSFLYYNALANNAEPKGRVALIYAEGMIIDAPSRGPSRFAGNEVIDTQSVVQAFDDAVKDDSIKAILFRVSSPGGSPVASETIRHAMIKAKEAKKPVFVSMGAVAASGGYWISMDANRIIAAPSTITGSIGVVAGKFALGGLFEKIGISWDGVATSETAQMLAPHSPFSPKARARMNAMLDDTYKTFTDNVAAARKIDPAKMPDIAKGRVYTGQQALQVGLVDELGGMQQAIDALKKEMKLASADKIELVQLPAPETPESLLKKAFENLRLGGAMILDLGRMWQQVRTELGPVLSAIQTNGRVQARYDGGVF